MALVFDGSSYLWASGGVPATPPVTLAGWARLAPEANGYVVALGDASGANVTGLFLYHSQGSVVANVRVNGVWTHTYGQAWGTGSWRHFAAVCEVDGSQRVYQDGVETGATGPKPVPAGMTQLTVGARPPGNVPLAGRLAEVGVWSAALGPDSIAMLAAGLTPLALAHHAGALVAYHDLLRHANRPGVGPTVSASGPLAIAAHPGVLAPGGYAGVPRVIPGLVAQLVAAQQAAAGSVAALPQSTGAATAQCAAA